MAKRGVLDVPVIGVASLEVEPGAAAQARRGRHQEVGRGSMTGRPCAVCSRCSATSTATTTTRPPSRRSRRRWARPGARRTTSPSRPRSSRRSSRGSAPPAWPKQARVIVEKPFGRDLASARELNRVARVGVSGRLDLPHRSLPGEGGDHEHPVFPLRQFVPGADLEPQLRGQRPDHAGRGFRRRGPRRVLRNRRLPARRRPEPSVPDRRAAGHGAADLPGLWRRARRNRRCLPGDAAAAARRPGARPVRRLPQGAGRGEAIPTSRPSAPCGSSSTRGAGRACRGTCAPASAWPRRPPR